MEVMAKNASFSNFFSFQVWKGEEGAHPSRVPHERQRRRNRQLVQCHLLVRVLPDAERPRIAGSSSRQQRRSQGQEQLRQLRLRLPPVDVHAVLERSLRHRHSREQPDRGCGGPLPGRQFNSDKITLGDFRGNF